MTLSQSLHNTFNKPAAIPVHSYQDYPAETLENIHYADQYLPVFAFLYIIIIFAIYVYQVCRRFHKFDPNIIPIHHMGLICLFVTVLYCVLLFMESHRNTLQLSLLNSCLTEQRMHLIALVIVKYFTTWNIIFNLSYMNQSPFFNPRYKYISKKRRKFLRLLFLFFKWIIGIFLPIGIFSAYRRAAASSFESDPDNFPYCYLTFSIKNFLLIFVTDILGIILYGM